MIDAYAIDTDPPAIIHPARGRGRSGRGRSRNDRQQPQPPRGWIVYPVGAVLILSDGRECTVIEDRADLAFCRDERGDLWRITK